MAIAASMLGSEMRRHLLMNVSLVASCIVGGTVVTNERGLFVPLSIHGGMSAFAAMFTQSHLLPDTGLTDVRMISPLDPFEVTADSRDLRRRLMDSLSWLPEEASEYNKELAQVSNQTLTPTELASNDSPDTVVGGATGGTGGSASDSSSGGSTAPVAKQQQQQQQQTSILPSSKAQAMPDVTPEQAAAANATADTTTQPTTDVGVAAVPEPSSWAMLIAGFGMIGYLLRTRARREPAGEIGQIAL